MEKSTAHIVNQEDINRLLKLDPVFKSIYDEYGTPPNWTRPQGFTSLSKIILEQQVSLASAEAHFNKLNNFLPTFTPAEILKLTDIEMRTCQISWQKAKYLRTLSDALLKGDLDIDNFPNLTETEVRNQLTNIKGIGNWTADIYLLFCLQAKDIFPIGDIAIVNTIKELTSAKTKEEILLLAENWQPLRSLATYFLWHYYLKKRGRS
ncbi:MAG: DNA-3-methyladenine glycosylase 2 family protein [Flavobacteriales bacterium]|nr:DNA-3-methyladenine glycosylase 2 family protein [Flavobacteriales bacterium]